MAVRVILEGQLTQTRDDGEVLVATLDEGAEVGAGLHVRFTSVDKHRLHRALGLVAEQRVRVSVELISEPLTTPTPAPAPQPQPAPAGDRWAELVERTEHRRAAEGRLR